MDLSTAFLAGFFGGLLSSGLVISLAAYKVKKKLEDLPFGGL